MWDSLTKYRKKWFSSYDTTSSTLEEVKDGFIHFPALKHVLLISY